VVNVRGNLDEKKMVLIFVENLSRPVKFKA
jgi:hypothetical protein